MRIAQVNYWPGVCCDSSNLQGREQEGKKGKMCK